MCVCVCVCVYICVCTSVCVCLYLLYRHDEMYLDDFTIQLNG